MYHDRTRTDHRATRRVHYRVRRGLRYHGGRYMAHVKERPMSDEDFLGYLAILPIPLILLFLAWVAVHY